MFDINKMLEKNKLFVENEEYLNFNTTKYPNKKVAILTCMDTRLIELLPAAINIQNGDVKMIKNAGALISNPFGSVMRSLIVAIYELGVDQILVINHYDCGMQSLDPAKIKEKMINCGVNLKDLEFINYLGVDINNWLKGFEDPVISVRETVKIIRNHPLIPKDISVYGFLMDPKTGRLDTVE